MWNMKQCKKHSKQQKLSTKYREAPLCTGQQPLNKKVNFDLYINMYFLYYIIIQMKRCQQIWHLTNWKKRVGFLEQIGAEFRTFVFVVTDYFKCSQTQQQCKTTGL